MAPRSLSKINKALPKKFLIDMQLDTMQTQADLSYEHLTHLKKFHAAWRLLCSDLAPFVISFLYKVFLRANRRSISITDLADELDHFLYILRQKYPLEAPTRSAKEYIEIWSSPETAWLSQRYSGRNDTPEVDLTPDAEKALRWLENLQPRTFVGTESRLLTIFQLLKELNQKIETDPEQLLADLYQKKAEIEEQISSIKQGNATTRLDSTQIKERYYQLDDTANTLLADFRQVEENFRTLDREVREKITLATKTKGDVIDDIFGEQEAISESDQGRSFRAFWEFLIHNDRQYEFEQMLQKVLQEPDIRSLPDKGVLPYFRDFLVEAGNKVYVVNNTMTNQLSRFLADKGRTENKRIVELVAQIEKRGLQMRDYKFSKNFFTMDHLKPSIPMPLSRPLFNPPENTPLLSPETNREHETPELEALNKLFDTHSVDENELLDFIEKTLVQKEQISLEEIITLRPIQKGLSELIIYLKIAENRPHSHISEKTRFIVELEAPVHTEPAIKRKKRIHCPHVIFQRISS